MKELVRLVREWLRRLLQRRKPGYAASQPGWEQLSWFPVDGITGDPGTRTFASPPLEHRATVLRDERGSSSR